VQGAEGLLGHHAVCPSELGYAKGTSPVPCTFDSGDDVLRASTFFTLHVSIFLDVYTAFYLPVPKPPQIEWVSLEMNVTPESGRARSNTNSAGTLCLWLN